MKIVDFETFVCKAPLKRVMWSLQPWSGGLHRTANFIETVIVKLSTSNGLVGYGQTVGVCFKESRILSDLQETLGIHCPTEGSWHETIR